MRRFRGYTVSSQAGQRISGKKFAFTATGVNVSDGTTITITLSQTATATIADSTATTANIVSGTITSQFDAANANHPAEHPAANGDIANVDVSLHLNPSSPPPPPPNKIVAGTASDSTVNVTLSISTLDGDEVSGTMIQSEDTALDNKLITRKSALTSEERDFYFIHWPKLRSSFKGLPEGVGGEFDYLHFYKRNSSGQRTSRLQAGLLQSVRLLKPSCGSKDSRGNYPHSYLRTDAKFISASRMRLPTANFFSRREYHSPVSPFTSSEGSCKFDKVTDIPRNFEGSESQYTSRSFHQDFMCVAHGGSGLKGYLCYARSATDPSDGILHTCTTAPSLGQMHRGIHCMCAIPGNIASIKRYQHGYGTGFKSNTFTLEGGTEHSGNNLSNTCAQITGAKPYKSIALQGDAGDLTTFGSPKTLMRYLKDTHSSELSDRGEGGEKRCIAGLDYIDLCEDDSFDTHPQIGRLRQKAGCS